MELSSLRRYINKWLWVLWDSDYWHFAIQIADPSSRQRGRPKTKSKAIVRQKKGKRKIWSWVPKGCPTPRRIGRLTVITSTQHGQPPVPRDSDPRKTALARISSKCKLQTQPLGREAVSHQQICNKSVYSVHECSCKNLKMVLWEPQVGYPDVITCGRFPWKAPTSPPPRRLMIRGWSVEGNGHVARSV
jgi:hypothetical protein